MEGEPKERREGSTISWARQVAQWVAASRGSAHVRWCAGHNSTTRGQTRGWRARWCASRRKAIEREPGQAGSESGVRWERRARKSAQAERAAQPRRRSSLRPQRGRRSRQDKPPRSLRPEVTSRRSGEKLCTCVKLQQGRETQRLVTFRWEEKRRVNVSWPVRERRSTRRSPRPTGARIDLKIKVVAIIMQLRYL